MAKIAYLPQTRPGNVCTIIAAGPLFEAAWRAYPDTGKRRSSRRLAVLSWARAALETGERDLLNAVLRYVKEDPDAFGTYGAAGFHKWLDQGRWEHWI